MDEVTEGIEVEQTPEELDAEIALINATIADEKTKSQLAEDNANRDFMLRQRRESRDALKLQLAQLQKVHVNDVTLLAPTVMSDVEAAPAVDQVDPNAPTVAVQAETEPASDPPVTVQDDAEVSTDQTAPEVAPFTPPTSRR